MARPFRYLLDLLARRLGELRRLGPDRGTIMFITTASMTVVIGMSAVGIDMSQWYQKHHQAQLAADAAALAAANCMANVGISLTGSTSTCTSTTDTTDAANVAVQYAADNGVTIPTSDVSFTSTSVSVTTPDPAQSFFANFFGIHATPTAHSTASWTAPITSSCDASQESSGACLFAFARDSNCPDVGMTLQNNGNVRVNGGIWSNSSISTLQADNNSVWGNATYGNGATCTWLGSTAKSSGPKFTSGPNQHSPIDAWPRDYTKVLPCGSGSSYAYSCNSSGLPSYCTQSAANFSSLSLPSGSDNQVYCAYGTSTNLSDPSTWNGTINVTASTTTKTGISDSFIGGNVSITTQGSITLSAALHTSLGNLLAYAGEALSPAATVTTQGSSGITGDVFAPAGEVLANSGGTAGYTTFLQGQTIDINASGGMTGEGPQTGLAGTSPLPGSDSLTQ
jgi:hypothetical protein